jgi:hypothetical protein
LFRLQSPDYQKRHCDYASSDDRQHPPNALFLLFLLVFFDVSQRIANTRRALKYMGGYLLKRLRVSDLLVESKSTNSLRVRTVFAVWIWVCGNQNFPQALPKLLFFVLAQWPGFHHFC